MKVSVLDLFLSKKKKKKGRKLNLSEKCMVRRKWSWKITTVRLKVYSTKEVSLTMFRNICQKIFHKMIRENLFIQFSICCYEAEICLGFLIYI